MMDTSTLSTFEHVAEVRVTAAAGQSRDRSDRYVAGTKTVSDENCCGSSGLLLSPFDGAIVVEEEEELSTIIVVVVEGKVVDVVI